MSLLHPLWLAALLPWAALVAYLVRRGVPTSIAVPFLQLWPGGTPSSVAAARRPAPLPWSIVLLLVALLLAILAGAGPARLEAAANVTILVDRGLTTSVGGELRSLIESVDRQLHAGNVRLLLLPGTAIDTDGRSWAALAQRAGPTAVDTESMLRQAVTASLARDGNLIIAITDVSLPANPRVLTVSPRRPLTNVGIASFAVSDGPHPQAMVRVRNRSNDRAAKITIVGGPTPTSRSFKLPNPGDDCDVFIDLPGPLADVVTATLVAEHTSPVNDHAQVVRTPGGPLRWSTVGSVPDSVKRMIDVYSRLRPPRIDAATATVRLDTTDGEMAGVRLVTSRTTPTGQATPVVTPDRLTADVRTWPPPADGAASAPAGWRVLVRSGDTPLLAAAADGRQVWFNGRLDRWATTSDFVVFFANVLDAIADGSGEWAADLPRELPTAWRAELPMPADAPLGDWPGVYAGPAGRVALNAPPLPPRQPTAASSLSLLPTVGNVATATITAWLAAVAVVLGCIAFTFPLRGRRSLYRVASNRTAL